MFVLSMKTTRSHLAGFGVALGLLAAVLLLAKQPAAITTADGGDDARRVAYLQEQGYEVQPQWVDVREITVPDAEGVPAAYRGKRIKCFTYATATGESVYLYEYNGMMMAARPAAQEG